MLTPGRGASQQQLCPYTTLQLCVCVVCVQARDFAHWAQEHVQHQGESAGATSATLGAHHGCSRLPAHTVYERRSRIWCWHLPGREHANKCRLLCANASLAQEHVWAQRFSHGPV